MGVDHLVGYVGALYPNMLPAGHADFAELLSRLRRAGHSHGLWVDLPAYPPTCPHCRYLGSMTQTSALDGDLVTYDLWHCPRHEAAHVLYQPGHPMLVVVWSAAGDCAYGWPGALVELRDWVRVQHPLAFAWYLARLRGHQMLLDYGRQGLVVPWPGKETGN